MVNFPFSGPWRVKIHSPFYETFSIVRRRKVIICKPPAVGQTPEFLARMDEALGQTPYSTVKLREFFELVRALPVAG
jgi:hypothetical protein